MKRVESFWIAEQRQGRWCGAAKMFAQELCHSCEAEVRGGASSDDVCVVLECTSCHC